MSRILINPDEVDAVAKEFQAKREQSQQFIHSLDSKIFQSLIRAARP